MLDFWVDGHNCLLISIYSGHLREFPISLICEKMNYLGFWELVVDKELIFNAYLYRLKVSNMLIYIIYIMYSFCITV